MMQPKKSKYKKAFRGKMRGLAKGGDKLAYGEFGLQAISRDWVDGRQIEAARRTIVNHTKRRGKTWIKVFPHKPVTAKSSEIKRGGGKGEVDRHIAVVKPGLILIEIGGLQEDIAKRALELASRKFSVKTRIIEK